MRLLRRNAGPAPREAGRRLKIAYYADSESPNGWYRAGGPMHALGQRGHEIRQLARTRRRARLKLLPGCDVIHVHRQHDTAAVEIVEWARRTGVPFSWDNDDAFELLPSSNVGSIKFRGLHGRRRLRTVRQLALAADIVTTPSAFLATQFREWGAEEVRLIENHPRDELPGFRPGPVANRFVIGWIAAREHHLDVERVPIVAALGRLLDAYPQVEVRTVGLKLPLRHERYTYTASLAVERQGQGVRGCRGPVARFAGRSLRRPRRTAGRRHHGRRRRMVRRPRRTREKPRASEEALAAGRRLGGGSDDWSQRGPVGADDAGPRRSSRNDEFVR